jgi:hypothetical protein
MFRPNLSQGVYIPHFISQAIMFHHVHFLFVQMSSLKWLGIWGMVRDYGSVTKEDLDKWSRGMRHVFDDPKGRYYFEKFADECGIELRQGECTLFQHFTIRPITCNFK